MLDLPHLCHQIRDIQDLLRRVAPGQHQFRPLRFGGDQLQQLFDVKEAKTGRTVDFIADKEVIATGGQQLFCPDKRFLRRAPVFGDVFGVDPPRSAGLDDGQLRREPDSGQMFAITPPPLMNWNMQTVRPRPTARSASPSAAVVFPLPLPV